MKRAAGSSKETKPFSCSHLVGVVLVILALGGCGGKMAAAPPSGGGSGPPPFQARPFPGDYFTRLPNQGAGGTVPSEAYDPSTKEVFISNPDVNAVEVYSTVDGHHVGEITVSGPAGLSFSPDYTRLLIGTITPYVYFADPAKLQVTGQIAIPPSLLTTDQMGTTAMPVMPYALADGSIFLGLGGTPESASRSSLFVDHIILYNPTSEHLLQRIQEEGSSALLRFRSDLLTAKTCWLLA